MGPSRAIRTVLRAAVAALALAAGAAASVLGVPGRAVLAAAPAGTEPLRLLGISSHQGVVRIRASFQVPSEADSRELRGNPIAVGVGDGAAFLVDPHARGLRVTRHGTKARFKAPRKLTTALRRLTVSTASGAFDATWRGRLTGGLVPVLELSFGGHRYRFDPADLDPGDGTGGSTGGTGGGTTPPGTTNPPDGVVPMQTYFRGPVTYANGVSSIGNVVIRSATELGDFAAKLQTQLTASASVDFGTQMLLVVSHDPTSPALKMWSVTVTQAAESDGSLLVDYDRNWGPICCGGPDGDAPPTPPWGSGIHVVVVPRTTSVVKWFPHAVKRQAPWD